MCWDTHLPLTCPSLPSPLHLQYSGHFLLTQWLEHLWGLLGPPKGWEQLQALTSLEELRRGHGTVSNQSPPNTPHLHTPSLSDMGPVSHLRCISLVQ